MASRKPLVSVSGIINEMPSGDTMPYSALLASAADYIIAGRWDGVTTASVVLLGHLLPRVITLPASLAGSLMTSTVAAAASTAFVLSYLRGTTRTTIGTFTFASAAKTATISGVSIPTLQVGDILDLTGPATPDTTLANIYATILGVKS